MVQKIKVGDLVIRPSHGGDIVFQVAGIDEDLKIAALKGKDLRLIADAPLDDLIMYAAKKKISVKG